jgi:hypothetical protein
MQETQSVLRPRAKVNLPAVMVRCGLGVVALVCVMALAVGFAMALPSIGDAIGDAWYGWAKLLTRHYTTVVPATVTEWSSLAVTAWCVCVWSKLDDADDSRAAVFGVVAVVVLLLGVEVTQCALFAMTDGWTASAGHSAWEIAAMVTVFIIGIVHALIVLIAVCFIAT